MRWKTSLLSMVIVVLGSMAIAPSVQAEAGDCNKATVGAAVCGDPRDSKYVCRIVGVDPNYDDKFLYGCVCRWGSFEAIDLNLMGYGNLDICEFLNTFSNNDLGGSVLVILNFVITALTALVIIIAMISMVIAGYIYMTAGGSADRVSLAKSWIIASLLGITIAVTAWTILYMINPLLIG